jgi:hypothetical protein
MFYFSKKIFYFSQILDKILFQIQVVNHLFTKQKYKKNKKNIKKIKKYKNIYKITKIQII